MTREEAIKELSVEYLGDSERIIKAKKMAIKALEQMPVTTTTEGSAVIYYPQVEGVTPTVVDAGKQDPCDTCGYEEGSIYCKEHCPHEAKIEQEPCEMTAEEYRQRMIQAFHNADTDELIAVCVLPTEKEFEHLEWLLKNHYKKEPCCDAIDRKLVYAFLFGLISDETERKKALEYINELPPVNPTKTGHWIYKQYGGYPECGNWHCSECDEIDNRTSAHCPNCGAKMIEPQESEVQE